MKTALFAYCQLFIFVFNGVESKPVDKTEGEIQLHDHCIKETGVDPGFIDKANNFEMIPDPTFKCYIKCVLETAGLITPDNKIDADKFGSIMYGPFVERRVNNIKLCQTQPGTDLCDSMYQTFMCYLEHDTEVFYVP